MFITNLTLTAPQAIGRSNLLAPFLRPLFTHVIPADGAFTSHGQPIDTVFFWDADDDATNSNIDQKKNQRTFTWRNTFVRRVSEVLDNQAQILYGICNYVTKLLIIFLFRYSEHGNLSCIHHGSQRAYRATNSKTLCPLDPPNI
jgi:hypothetical protein